MSELSGHDCPRCEVELYIEASDDLDGVDLLICKQCWGVGVTACGSHSSSHTGTVTSHSENTRSTDFSARYSIDVEATQNPPAEGLARFTQMLASTLEPVDTQAK